MTYRVEDPSEDLRRGPAGPPFRQLPAAHVMVGLVLGAIVAIVVQLVLHRWYVSLLVGWDILALTFIVWTWSIVWRFDASATEHHASAEEPGRRTVHAFIGIGVTEHIQPMTGVTNAVLLALEQLVDDLLIGVRRFVFEVRLQRAQRQLSNFP